MFENLQRELKRIQKTTQVAVPLEKDADGYLDKECPAPGCLFPFKVHGEDWADIVRDEEVFCPSCRQAAPATSWYTSEQVESAKEYALDQLKNGLNTAMRADARASKRRQRKNAFFSITLETRGGHDTILVPIAAAEPMRLKTECETCKCRYSYIGAAYFCPSCGKNSASQTFAQTLSAVRVAASMGPTLRQSVGRDEAEVLNRTLLEKAMQDTVMSFQRLCEQLYEAIAVAPARRNAFQNLDAGSELWGAVLGTGYEGLIRQRELAQLKVFFQQRHLLAHKQGIVDDDYIQRSGDTNYAVGQRLVVREQAVTAFADGIEKLGLALLSRT